MDNQNKLTPNKIQRLINFAQSKSFHGVNRTLFQEFRQEYLNPTDNPLDVSSFCNNVSTPATTTESLPIKHISENQGTELSSGILDLDQCPGLDEYSLTVGSFIPGEMTGRSTGTTDNQLNEVPQVNRSNMFECGRYSASTIDDFAKKMEKQTTDIQQLMRQSICSASFHSKQPNLTADEVSFAMDKAPLPVNPNQLNKEIKEPVPNGSADTSQLSYVAGYFRDRCIDFGNVFPRSDSPQYDISGITRPSEVSNSGSNRHTVDATLDNVPVRESRQIDKATQKTVYNSKTPIEVQTWPVKDAPMAPPSPGPWKSSNRPTLLNAPTKQYLQMAKPNNDSSESELESIRISNIRNYLADNSAYDVLLTDILKLPFVKKQPLTEVNKQVSKLAIQDQVMTLKDSKKTETASSAGTLNTVISVKSNKENLGVPNSYLPKPVATVDAPETTTHNVQSLIKDRSKSPSSKSHSTLSTVQEVSGLTTPKTIDSPLMNKTDENNRLPVNTALNEYRELDKSINWAEIIGSGGSQRRTDRFSQVTKISAEISTTPVSGFVGVRLETIITVTTKTQNWLTAKLQFDSHSDEEDIMLDLPRFPTLLSPGQPENFKIQMTFKKEITTCLPITLLIKDEASETEAIESASLEVDIKMPIIQALAAAEVNRVTFPPLLEGQIAHQGCILISDCPADLQLELAIADGNSMFFINSLQEIKKEDVNKNIFDVNAKDSKSKRHKQLNKHFCRLSRGHAIKVIVGFKAQKLIDLQFPNNILSFNCCMDVYLIGVATPLKKVELSALVGTCCLVTNIPDGVLHVVNGSTEITVSNNGSALGKWMIRIDDPHCHFEVPLDVVEIQPGCNVHLTVLYTGPEDVLAEGKLTFEEATTGAVTTVQLRGGKCPSKSFPLKANYTSLSWVRPGEKELHLKNFTDNKVSVRCTLISEGFKIHGPRSTCQNVLLNFGPKDIRQIPIVFEPTTYMPCFGILYISQENNNEFSKKVYLYGCNSGEPLRWTGLVTFGDMALVRAIARKPVQFKLLNRAKTPAFVAASVTLNLPFMSLQANCKLRNGRCIIPGRSSAELELSVDWTRVDKILRDSAAASTTLAMVTVHTGPEFTRRRIIKLLRNNSDNELDSSSLPEHLQTLLGPFDGDDTTLDNHLKDFEESETALNELVSGLQKLIAQIDIQHDIADENTIVINDDTKYEHHTLID